MGWSFTARSSHRKWLDGWTHSLYLGRAPTSFTGRLLTDDIMFSWNGLLSWVSSDSPVSRDFSIFLQLNGTKGQTGRSDDKSSEFCSLLSDCLCNLWLDVTKGKKKSCSHWPNWKLFLIFCEGFRSSVSVVSAVVSQSEARSIPGPRDPWMFCVGSLQVPHFPPSVQKNMHNWKSTGNSAMSVCVCVGVTVNGCLSLWWLVKGVTLLSPTWDTWDKLQLTPQNWMDGFHSESSQSKLN